MLNNNNNTIFYFKIKLNLKRLAREVNSKKTNDHTTRTMFLRRLEETMSGPAKYFIVEASAMPEIFRKVAEAKRLLETGEEKTVNAAAQAVERYGALLNLEKAP